MRTHAEWDVATHIAFVTGPTSSATRRRISSAALFVNVIARIAVGGTPSSMRWAMRWVSTLVLPDPAPATTSSGPPRCTTASSWSGFKLMGELILGTLRHSHRDTGTDGRLPCHDDEGDGGNDAAAGVSAGSGGRRGRHPELGGGAARDRRRPRQRAADRRMAHPRLHRQRLVV